MVIRDEVGFHTRTAAMFAKMAACFSCQICVSHRDNRGINGKSMLGLMSLGVKHGGVITVVAEGHDADKALIILKELVENNFLLPA